MRIPGLNRLGAGVGAAAAVLALLIPGISAACSVCMTGREDETRVAFEVMTAFMTLIPFILVGGVIYWLRGRVRELEAMHERARAESVQALLDDKSDSSTTIAVGSSQP